MIGKTRQEIIEVLGENYHPESNDNALIYIIGRTWLSKGKALFIEFNDQGIADTIYTLKNYDFKK